MKKQLQLKASDQLHMEDMAIFDRKFLYLSARAKNILMNSGLNSYIEFLAFISVYGTGSFQKFRNCGALTQLELEDFARVFLVNDQDNPINYFGIKYPVKELNFNVRQIKTFNSKFNGLSQKMKDILLTYEITDLHSFYCAFHMQPLKEPIDITDIDEKTGLELSMLKKLVNELVKQADTDYKKGFFSDFNEIYFNSYGQIQQDIFSHYFEYAIKPGRRFTLEAICNKNSVTRERIRQVSNKLKEQLIRDIKELDAAYDYSTFYCTDQEYFIITDQFCNEINARENTGFTKSFMNYSLAKILAKNFSYHPIEHNNAFSFGLFINTSIRFEFDSFFMHIHIISNQPHKNTEKLSMDTLISMFTPLNNGGNISKAIIDKIIKVYYELLKKETGRNIRVEGDYILIAANKKTTIHEHIADIFEAHGKPLHYKEIYNRLKEKGIVLKSPTQVHTALISYDLFGVKGQGVWGLKKWGGYFGTIGDITEQYLTKKGKPVDMTELRNFLHHELVISDDSIVGVLLHYEHEKRFIRIEDNTVGLRSWFDKT